MELDKVKTLFHKFFHKGSDPLHYGFFINPYEDIAFAGQATLYPSVMVHDRAIRLRVSGLHTDGADAPGHFSYVEGEDGTFTAHADGLPRNYDESGTVVTIDTNEMNEKFNTVIKHVENGHTIVINPLQFIKHIERRVYVAGGSMKDRVFSLEYFDGVNRATSRYPALLTQSKNEVLFKNGLTAAVDMQKSLIPENMLEAGKYYVCEKVDKKDDLHIVRIVREARRGIFSSIQKFDNSLRLWNDGNYTTLPERNYNSISADDIACFEFVEGQKMGQIDIPTPTWELSDFYRTIKPFEMFKRVVIQFKNNYSPVHIYSLPEQGKPTMDAIIHPLIPFNWGLVCANE